MLSTRVSEAQALRDALANPHMNPPVVDAPAGYAALFRGGIVTLDDNND